MKPHQAVIAALIAAFCAGGCLNLNAEKVYRLRVVDHDTGLDVPSDPQIRLLTNIEYFTSPTSHDPLPMGGSTGEFKLHVRWVALAVHVYRAPYPQTDWPYLPAQVTFDRRVKPGIYVESPRRYGDAPDPETRYRKTYPINEQGVILIPLFRKPTTQPSHPSTQPIP